MFKKSLKYLAVIVLSVLLASFGIDAADHYGDMSQSIFGKMLGGKESRCPDDMVFVPTENNGFCIDKYEATAGDKCPVDIPKSQPDTVQNLDAIDCQPVSMADQKPWVNISQAQAMEACSKAGKRLPTAEEWYLASLGTPDKNDSWDVDDCQLARNWTEYPGNTGTAKNCLSGVGAYDMIGNVWELVKAEMAEGLIDGKPVPNSGYIKEVDTKGMALKTDEATPDPNYKNDYLWMKNTGSRAMARGGYWDSKSDGGRYSVYLVTPISSAGDGIGFRCAK